MLEHIIIYQRVQSDGLVIGIAAALKRYLIIPSSGGILNKAVSFASPFYTTKTKVSKQDDVNTTSQCRHKTDLQVSQNQSQIKMYIQLCEISLLLISIKYLF